MIERDETQRSIVVTCADCGARDIVGTRDQADLWGIAHLRRHVEINDENRRRAVAAAAARRRRRDTPG